MCGGNEDPWEGSRPRRLPCSCGHSPSSAAAWPWIALGRRKGPLSRRPVSSGPLSCVCVLPIGGRPREPVPLTRLQQGSPVHGPLAAWGDSSPRTSHVRSLCGQIGPCPLTAKQHRFTGHMLAHEGPGLGGRPGRGRLRPPHPPGPLFLSLLGVCAFSSGMFTHCFKMARVLN